METDMQTTERDLDMAKVMTRAKERDTIAMAEIHQTDQIHLEDLTVDLTMEEVEALEIAEAKGIATAQRAVLRLEVGLLAVTTLIIALVVVTLLELVAETGIL